MTGMELPTGRARRQRRGHEPEAAAETASVLRLLMVQPWLVAGRDDAAIATVRRNEAAVRDALGRLGWVLVVERDIVRLRKSPPVRRDAWAAGGPNPLTCSWFFLLVAAAESMPPRVSIGQLVTAARAAAAEAEVPAPDDKPERHAILSALKKLDERGVVESIDGDINEFLRDDNPPVLLAVYHHRLVHVVVNFGTADPVTDPAGWLEQVEREIDPARRMRRRLIDDTAVLLCDVAEIEGGVVDLDRPGWRGLEREQILTHLGVFAQRYAGRGWSAEHVDNLPGLATEAESLLTGAGLLRSDRARRWWFSPAAGRWERPPELRPAPDRTSRTRTITPTDTLLEPDTVAGSAST